MAGNISDESVHDPARGYYSQTISLGPAFLASSVDPGAWGPDFTRLLDAYENTAGCWLVSEDMPQESNAVSLNSTVVDDHGLPVAHVHGSQFTAGAAANPTLTIVALAIRQVEYLADALATGEV